MDEGDALGWALEAITTHLKRIHESAVLTLNSDGRVMLYVLNGPHAGPLSLQQLAERIRE